MRQSIGVVALLIMIPALRIAWAEGPPVENHQEPSPNIILLVTDDHRQDALGAYGNEIIQTPHIDLMAEQGVLFENMFVATSICTRAELRL